VTEATDSLYFHRLVSALGPNEDGLSDDEVAAIEARYGFTFPPELRALLQYCVPISTGPHAFPNWRLDSEDLRQQLRSPIQEVLADVEEIGWWSPNWGERPYELAKALEVATAALAFEPKLVPVFGHRYLPSGTHVGVPVFSVHHTDVIYYGFSLQGYFRNEFHVPVLPDGLTEPLYVPFWGEIANANVAGPRDWWNHQQ